MAKITVEPLLRVCGRVYRVGVRVHDLMVKFIGNILTSHAQADKHPERGTKQFHITPDEASLMNVTGLPVHLEHAGNVKVGKVTKSWNDKDGKKWVLADVDTSTIEGKYVRNDLCSAVPRYKGLSLQHMYREYADGSSNKEAIEVSICREPRRPGCEIVHAATNAPRYKVPRHVQRNMTDDSSTITTNELTPTAESTAVAASAAAPPVPSAQQLMAEVVEASHKNEQLKRELEEKSNALAAVEARELEVQKLALEQQTEMATKLGDAVLEHVAKLDPSLANEDTTTAIATLRDKYPKEIARVMEVACCASKHAQKLELELADQKDTLDRKLMEQAYHAAVAARPGCHGTSTEVIVEAAVPASKRHRANDYVVSRSAEPTSTAQHFSGPDNMTLNQIKEAYNGLKGSGSTVDAMKSVAGILNQQRQRGFR